MSDTCPHCGAEADLAASIWCPACREDVTRRPRPRRGAQAQPVAQSPGPGPGDAVPASVDVWHCRTLGCDGYAVPLGRACPLCGASAPAEGEIRLIGDGFDIVLAGAGPWMIGREAPDSPQLSGLKTVSRRHAEIVRGEDRVRIRDLRSTNGTFVDEARVAGDGEADLCTGACVRLGKAVRLHVEL